MSKNDNNKTMIYAGVGVCVALVIGLIAFFTTRGGGNNGGDKTGDTGKADNGTSSETSKFDNPDVEITFGDYDSMYTLSKDIQNGLMTGKIVKVVGTISHPGTSYSIVQSNEEGTQKIGTVFTIEDGTEADYPKEGARVKMTAKVVEVSALNFQLVTSKDYFIVEEE